MLWDQLKDKAVEVLTVFSMSGKLQFAFLATVLVPILILVFGALWFGGDAAPVNPIVASVNSAIVQGLPWAALLAFIKFGAETVSVYRKEWRRLSWL